MQQLSPVALLGRVRQRRAEGGPYLIAGDGGSANFGLPVGLAVGRLGLDRVVRVELCEAFDAELGELRDGVLGVWVRWGSAGLHPSDMGKVSEGGPAMYTRGVHAGGRASNIYMI